MRSSGLTRRRFLAGASGAALALDPVVAAAARRRPRLAADGAFPTGLASGLPKPRGITLWTRCELDGEAGHVQLEVARDRGFARVVHRELLNVRSEDDWTVQRRLAGRRWMRPGDELYYRFSTGNASTEPGRFRLLRPADSAEPVRIGFFTCQGFSSGYYTGHAALAKERDLDLVVCLGDYIYEGYGESALEGRDVVRPDGRTDYEELQDFRFSYRRYRSDPNLQAVHAAHPIVPVWDDHEVQNDYWRDGVPRVTGSDAESIARFHEMRDAAYRAWFENMPVPRIGTQRSTRIFRSLRLGALAEVIFLDSRQYRDLQPCGGLRAGGPYILGCPDTTAPRDYLGPEQKAWFKERLGSSAAWKVVANPQMIMAQDLPQGQAYNLDTWDAYRAERRELMEHILREDIHDVVFMTGDDHNHYAGRVTTTGDDSGTTAAAEIVVPALSSGLSGQPTVLEDPATYALNVGRYLSNPHWIQFDPAHHGYAVVKASADELTCAIRSPATVVRPTAPVSMTHFYRVARGTRGIEGQ